MPRSPTPPPRLPKAHTNSERANERALSHAPTRVRTPRRAPAEVWEKHEVEAAGFVWRGNATAKSSHDELHKKFGMTTSRTRSRGAMWTASVFADAEWHPQYCELLGPRLRECS